MEDQTLLAIVGILCLTILESCALLTGYDGQLFSLIVAAVSGISGFALRDPILVLKKKIMPSEIQG